MARNEASQAAMGELEDPLFQSTTVSFSLALFLTPAKTEGREVTGQETQDSLTVFLGHWEEIDLFLGVRETKEIVGVTLVL